MDAVVVWLGSGLWVAVVLGWVAVLALLVQRVRTVADEQTDDWLDQNRRLIEARGRVSGAIGCGVVLPQVAAGAFLGEFSALHDVVSPPIALVIGIVISVGAARASLVGRPGRVASSLSRTDSLRWLVWLVPSVAGPVAVLVAAPRSGAGLDDVLRWLAVLALALGYTAFAQHRFGRMIGAVRPAARRLQTAGRGFGAWGPIVWERRSRSVVPSIGRAGVAIPTGLLDGLDDDSIDHLLRQLHATGVQLEPTRGDLLLNNWSTFVGLIALVGFALGPGASAAALPLVASLLALWFAWAKRRMRRRDGAVHRADAAADAYAPGYPDALIAQYRHAALPAVGTGPMTLQTRLEVLGAPLSADGARPPSNGPMILGAVGVALAYVVMWLGPAIVPPDGRWSAQIAVATGSVDDGFDHAWAAWLAFDAGDPARAEEILADTPGGPEDVSIQRIGYGHALSVTGYCTEGYEVLETVAITGRAEAPEPSDVFDRVWADHFLYCPDSA